jgi:hypothetical protein
VTKAKAEIRLRAWLASGSRFEVWSWSKRADKWEVKKTPLLTDNIDIRAIEPPRRRRRKIEPMLFAGAL